MLTAQPTHLIVPVQQYTGARFCRLPLFSWYCYICNEVWVGNTDSITDHVT